MRDHAVVAYSALSARNQVKFLVRLALEVTIWAREAYEVLTGDGKASAKLLSGYNDLQHKINAQTMHLLYDDDRRYPDDVFINILFDMSLPTNSEGKMVELFDDLYGSCLRRSGDEPSQTDGGLHSPV